MFIAVADAIPTPSEAIDGTNNRILAQITYAIAAQRLAVGITIQIGLSQATYPVATNDRTLTALTIGAGMGRSVCIGVG